jgi:DNA-binding transcriptional LysR family regulator
VLDGRPGEPDDDRVDPSVQALRCFLAVSRTRHFARAAAELHLSASALSDQVATLERQVGALLFTRNARRVELTDAGAQLRPHAQRVVDAHTELRSWAAARREGRHGDLRVGFLAGVSSAVLTPVLEAAVERLPGWQLQLRRLGFLDAVPALRDRQVDVALAPGPVDPPAVGLRGRELVREPRVLVVNARHRLAGRAAVTLDDIRDETLITASAGRDPAARWWAVDPRPDGGSPVYGPEARDLEEALQLVVAGLGVNIAVASAADRTGLTGVAVVPLSGVEDAGIWLLARADDPSPGVAALEQLAWESTAPLRS